MSLCLQVSGVRRPKARHASASEGSWRLADVTRAREEAAAAVGGGMQKRKWCVVCLLVFF